MTLSKVFAGLLGAGLLAGAAHATTITQSVTFGPGPTDFNSATGTSGSTVFSLFDTNLGTLNSITFGSSYGFTSTITIANNSASTATGSVYTQSASQFGSNSSAVTSVLNSLVNNAVDPIDGNTVTFGNSTLTPIAYDVRGSRTTYGLTPGFATSGTSTGSSANTGVVDTTASDLAAFSAAGGGSFTPTFSTLSGLVISNSGGNVTAVQTTSATGTLSISYNYTAATPTPTPTSVPEPASLALLGAGLFGLRALRRRGA